MIPYKIAFAVSLLIYTTNCQGSTFVYEDYLAYPKYKVGLTKKKIPESNVFGDQLKNTQQVGWWNSKVEQYNNQKQVIMMSSYNQPFLCNIPTVSPEEEEEEKNKYRQKHSSESSASETQHTIETGLKLLEPLEKEKECLYYHTNSYWTYEYCHNRHVRQFHIDHTKTESTAQDNIEGKSVYYLGRFPERINKEDPSALPNRNQDTTIHPASNTNSKNNGPSLLQQQHGKENHDKYVPGLTSTQLKQIEDKKLLVQRWGGGTLCDKTNQPRTTDIQFQCDMHPQGDHISNYQEISTCHYLMTISTPRLCDESMLTSTKKPKLHQIECNPIVPDHKIIAKNKLLGDDPSDLINNDIQQQDDNDKEKENEEPIEKINNDFEKDEQEISKKNTLEDQLLEVEEAFSLATSPETLMNMDVADLMGMVEKLSKQMDELKKQQDQLQQQQQQASSPPSQQQQSELHQVYYIINDNGQVEMVSGEKALPNSVNSEISKIAQALVSQMFTSTNQVKSSTSNSIHEKGKKSAIEESENQQQNRKVYEKSYYNTENNE
ncbi:hypothetical protein BJ944DRAFT_247044 [Cunninghamella echinulata]|nr:hypothetical protein BJ944DRAFT_247044 [Cunninghamella echinulata]